MKRVFRRPSPAMVVAIVALIAALGGTAVAGGVLTKKKVNKIITNRAPGLSVASAKSAENASNASVAQSPVAWAHIAANGNVLASSGNISQANEDNPYGDGEYCFKGLGFAFRSLQATVDGANPPNANINIIAQVAIPDTLDCAFGTGFSGTQASVETTNANTGTIFANAPFYVWFFN
jgi:hypothetical protein